MFGSETEIGEEFLVGCTGSKAGHADRGPVDSCVTVQSEGRERLDGDSFFDLPWKDFFLIGLFLFLEKIHTGHGYHSHLDAFFL